MSGIAKHGRPWILTLPLVYQGKTRDTFQAQWTDPNDKRRPPLLIVATDRISTHDVVHHSTIKQKGEVLTALTIARLIDVLERAGVAHHLVAYGREIYKYLPGKESDYPPNLHHRAIVVLRLDIIMVEFILRAYLGGSLWNTYYSKGLENPYRLALPSGLPLMYQFEEPIFTPTVKSDTDPALVSEEVEREYPAVVTLVRKVFDLGRKHLHEVGLELVDTKFELGLDEDGRLILADEVMTPDSSRFARLADIREGKNPPWLDKQVARDEAERVWAGGEKKPLVFDSNTVRKLIETYLEIFELIVGMPLAKFQRERLD